MAMATMDRTRAETVIQNFCASLNQEGKDNYNRLCSHRKPKRAAITKAYNGLAASLAAPGSPKEALEFHKNKVHDALKGLDEADQRLWQEFEDDDMIEADTFLGQHWSGPAEKLVIDAQIRINAFFAPSPFPPHIPSKTSSPSPPSAPQVRLPKVELPAFKGESPAEYQIFINQFDSLVHSASGLDNVQKFLYLSSCCQGEAKKIAEGFTCTADNYKNLYDTFKDTFGKPRLVQQSHISRILELEGFKNHSMKSFLNTLESSLRSLGEFKIDPEHLSPMLVPFIETKMPRDVLTKWREVIHDDKEFSTTKLISFLHERVECLPASSSNTHREDKKEDKQDKQKDVRPKTTTLLTTSAVGKGELNCKFCNKKSHTLEVCRFFAAKSRDERSEFIKKNNTCFRCLEEGHIAPKCTNDPLVCNKCQKNHPTSLHPAEGEQPQRSKPKGSQQTTKEKPPEIQEEQANIAQKTAVSTVKTAQPAAQATILKSFQTIAEGNDGKTSLVRALMDDGAGVSWVTNELVQELDLPIIGHSTFEVTVAFTKKAEPPKDYPVVELELTTVSGEPYTIKAHVRSDPLCADIEPVNFVPEERFKHLKKLQFADSYPRDRDSIDVIVGQDYYEAIKTGNRKLGGPRQPTAVETIFGWVLCGPCGEVATNTTGCHNVSSVPFKGIEEQLKMFYEAENLPQEKQEAKSFREQVQSNIVFDSEEKRYTVSIPYTDEVKKLQSNKQLAIAMTKKQERRLANDPKLEGLVKAYFDVQIENGMIEEVTEEDPSTQKHYLPWHPVVREGHPTTPCRNVMNASQKDSGGLSLNLCQEAGPNLLPDVCGLALNFRDNPIGIIMDISKMFLNIRINKDQKDLHRFLAFGKVLRQAMLLFGEKSSPYLALETVHKHAETMKKTFKLAAEEVIRKLYMDDVISGSKEVDEAIKLIQELINFFDSMHLKVHKINSNNPEVLKAIEPTLLENMENTGVLGIQWDTVQDTLSLKPLSIKNECSTKREFLATLASVYDPLGFHAPLTCKGKIIMQKLWAHTSDWDSTIPYQIQEEVTNWIKASEEVLKFPRYWEEVDEIHIFCDASEDAYAAVAYGVSNKSTGPAHLMLAKTRVKPLKPLTIPRMELLGAVLAANMAEFLTQYLGPKKIFFWTDSTVARGWIKSESSEYKVFVGNRTKLIHEKTNKDDWRWVPGSKNPADIPSRGIWPLNEDQKELWLHGPDFIRTGCYPEQPPAKKPTEECKKTAILTVSISPPAPVINIERFSNINRLMNATAYVFRFLNRKTGASKGPPSATEREVALQKIIKIDQNQWFAADIKALQDGQLKKGSKLTGLNPIMDEQGMLKMRGRVATEPELIILHNKSHLTELLIREAHKSNLHSGVSHTINDLRNKYWIIKGFATAKQAIKSCITCKKVNSRLASQQMASLPEWRTTPSPPFTHTGVDYAGPLYITKAGNQKRYILLFTCGVTRAVHLELTQTLDQKDFLLAFNRFTARRGVPSKIYSDNGTTFQAASQMLPEMEWNFIPPYAPWHGGFWERIVRSIKTPLRKVAGGARLKEKELTTLLTRIEGVINSRPLTMIRGNDAHRVITPAELLCGRPLQQVAAATMDFAPTKRIQHLEEVQRQFWKQWQSCYLPTLQQRPKWSTTSPNIKEGDIVLLLKENSKRHTWPLAKVIETTSGRDGLVRSVKLLSDEKEVIRPVQLIVPLEVQNDEDKHTGSSN